MQPAFASTATRNIVVAGEVLFDIIHGARHLGGAPFNFAAHLSKLGHAVHFVSAVGDDFNGREVQEKMQEFGLSTRYVRTVEEYPTGTVTVTLDDDGQPGYVVHRPAAYDFPAIPEMELAVLLHQKPEYIYFGTLQQMSSTARELTSQLLDAMPQATRFYDLNLRTGCYTPEVVRDLMTSAQIVKLNEQEVAEVQGMFQELRGTVEAFCHASLKQFRWHAVCVTQGAKGCTLCTGEEDVQSPGYSVKVADTVGAGDAFAAALLHGFALGMPTGAIPDFANRVGALVASRSGAIPQWTIEEALRLSR